MNVQQEASDTKLKCAAPLKADVDELNMLIDQSPVDKKSQDSRLIGALSSASVIIYLNLYLMQGMLPSIAEHFSVIPAKATLVLSVTSFSLAISLLFFALLSDRVGRRLPILVSLWLLALSNFPVIFVDDFSGLIWMRLVQGVLLAAVPAIAMAYFKEHLSPSIMLAAAAMYIAANSMGGIIGRLLGGLMSQYLSWQQSMQMMFALTLIGVAVVSYLLPSEERVQKSRSVQSWQRFKQGVVSDLNGFKYHLQDARMRLVFLIGGLAFMVMVNQFSFIQLHLMAEPFHWSRFEATLIFLCYLSGTIASYHSAKWIAKWGAIALFRYASALMILGGLLTLINTEVAICLGFLMTACGFFSIHSCCNSSVAIWAQSHRAKATALYLCCYYLGAAAGGPYLMPFWHNAGWQGVIGASLIVLTIMVWIVAKLAHKLVSMPAKA